MSSLASLAVSSFCPPQPHSLEQAGLNPMLVEGLLLKILLSKGSQSGRELASGVCLPFKLIDSLLADLKQRLLIGHKSTAGMGDFIYLLTDGGHEQALMAREVSAYSGPAPVSLAVYIEAVKLQSIRNEKPKKSQLEAAFSDLFLEPDLFEVLGPAVNSARGMFLYGEPGNGKTSIAERICRCFRDHLWIPQTLSIDGQLIQLFDPQMHVLVKNAATPSPVDGRWVCIERPVVVVGGELTLDSLEIQYNPLVKMSEAPLQLKANGGTFLIDDFGRQRVNPTELLNRWIVPLEKRIDFLTLPNGKKIEVPFDQLIIFSTNLNPKDLVDEAFLRRIPYKINVSSPNEDQFKTLFRIMCQRYSIHYEEPMVNYLIREHYRDKRPFRACHARDILDQVISASSYWGTEPRLTVEILNLACHNYFAAMDAV